MSIRKCILNFLTVGCWNIESIYENINSVKISKLEQPSFRELLNKHDIFCLQETHVSKEEFIPPQQGYDVIPHCREISENNRYFGGMLVYIKSNIRTGMKVNRSLDEDALEITLSKQYFGLSKDIKIFFTYASPINSPHTKNKLENVFEIIEMKCVRGYEDCVIMGDLNGRTRKDDDFVTDQYDRHSPINSIPSYNKDDPPISRNNMDAHPVDEQGKMILSICKTASLRILNGRTQGDTEGNFTRYPSNTKDNPSTIDYALCSDNMIGNIRSFSVLPFSGFSDHCCISANIRVNTRVQKEASLDGQADIDRPKTDKDINKETKKGSSGTTTKLISKKFSIKFDRSKEQLYVQALKDDPNINILKLSISQPVQSQETIDNTMTQVNNIILGAAKKATFVKKVKVSPPKSKKTHTWYSKECKANQRILRHTSKKLSENPFDKNARSNFVKARNRYKTICRKAESAARQNLIQKLIDLGKTDPKTFWNTIKQMNEWGKTKNDPCDDIDTDEWIDYFTKLLNDDKDVALPASTTTPTYEPTLDSRIKIKELRQALSNLKHGKACALDDILGEYLQIFGENFEYILLKIMNTIFVEKIYPTQWTTNFLRPIYKKGNPKDPDNYRGLAIGSAFAKLYSFILLNRLTEFIDIKKLISPNQIGFMKKMGTPDHIFLLQTIVEKVVKKNKNKLYVVFIDFKKAYDTVNRNRLFDKLKKLGINGTFIQNIEAMYKRTEYCIKLKAGHTPPILSNLGLKQGCPLSPMLFNLYIDDIKEIFDDECEPVTLQTTKINHFLYADDLVILSQSKEGLQRCLDKTHSYAKMNLLTISVKKSKSMIFNSNGKFIRNTTFHIGDENIEPVQEFCYLGVDIKCSGTVKHAANILNEKGNKALRPLLNVIARFKIPSKTAIKLFHTYISPIITYNTENLSKFSDNEIKKYKSDHIFEATTKSKIDTTHRKLLKFVMGVSRSCPNLAIYGDTGEIPLSLKSYRLTLNYWHRVTNMSNDTLVKIALLENISLRTNWIMTIEKLLNTLNLSDKIDNPSKFKRATQESLEKGWKAWWKQALDDPELSRLTFYREIKSEYGYEEYLNLTNFHQKRLISKLRCSDHNLEVEKGRHKPANLRKRRDERLCIYCNNGEVEDEKHFLYRCTLYSEIRKSYQIWQGETSALFSKDILPDTKEFIYKAFNLREQTRSNLVI